MKRNELLRLEDQDLLKHCEYESYRATGPGGQHRNKVETAVRLKLKEIPVIFACATERRSQFENKSFALKRLRIKIAMECREPEASFWPGPWNCRENSEQYPLFLATVLDALSFYEYQIAQTARHFQLSTGQFVRLLAADDRLWTTTNQERQKRKMRLLRRES